MTLEFSRSLYDADAVQAAATAWADLARIVVRTESDFVIAEITGPDPRVPDLADAFANHALYETIQRSRSGGA